MSKLLLTAVAAFALTAGAAMAQAPAAPAAPPPQAVVTKDPAAAIAGTYKIDVNHAAAIFRVAHNGFSISTVRFGIKEGTLVWNPANIASSKLTVVADMTPQFAPVVYGQDISGPNFLNLAQFPTATFVSTAIATTGPTTGRITGDLTFKGVTKPVVIEASLVGAGKSGRGAPMIGFTGLMKFKRSDFGFTFGGSIGNDVEVIVDGEFSIPPAAAPAGAAPAR